jgi:hypothetical protein
MTELANNGNATDKTDELYNQGLTLDFYHLPSDLSVSFKAYITNLTDNFNQGWNSEKVIGRSDPFQNYENTERVIALSWKIVAGSVKEAKNNLKNISKLAMMSYPKYDQNIEEARKGIQSATTITEAPIFRIKLMNMITSARTIPGGSGIGKAKLSGLPGRVDGFVFNHVIDDGYFAEKFEGITEDNSINDVKIYPKTVEASCTLYVLHDHALGWSADKNFRGSDYFPYDESSPSSDDFTLPPNTDEIDSVLSTLDDGIEASDKEATLVEDALKRMEQDESKYNDIMSEN